MLKTRGMVCEDYGTFERGIWKAFSEKVTDELERGFIFYNYDHIFYLKSKEFNDLEILMCLCVCVCSGTVQWQNQKQIQDAVLFLLL